MKAVILINFGGPRERNEIEPFLKDIFMDVLPSPLKRFAGIFAAIRKGYAERMYDKIGGSSPVVEWTEKQARMLEDELHGTDTRIYAGMRYGRPTIDEAVAKANKDGATEITLFPLFPYRSRYTTITLPKDRDHSTHTLARLRAYALDWHTHPLYIAAQAKLIKDVLAKWHEHIPTRTRLIFSVHAVPMSAIRSGDPYLEQVKESVAEIMKSFTGYDHFLSFQSATGPVKWTGPSVKRTLEQVSSHGSRLAAHVLLVPLGFACENAETLFEIDHIYIPYAKKLMPSQNVARTPAMNDEPLFIDLLSKLVLESMQR